MASQSKNDALPNSAALTAREINVVKKKVQSILAKIQHKILILGGILTPFVSLFVALMLRHQAIPLSYGITLFFLAIFIWVLFVSLITYMTKFLLKKILTLNLEKIYLSKKLTCINKLLEKRVKERTLELEDSLKLVTYQSTHDLLTNLPNHRLLIENLQSAIGNAYQHKKMFAVAVISLNELEKINDAMGHQASDMIMKMMSKRFMLFLDKINVHTNEMPTSIYLTRKDMFVMITPILQLDRLEEKMGILFSLVKNTFSIHDQSITLTLSMGVSVFPQDGEDIRRLLMNADASLSRAKLEGGNSLRIYRSEINADVFKTLEIETHLHEALKNNEFKLQYQPFVSLATGKICGAEALVRWHNPILGEVLPDRFVPIAETNGIILPLGEWVFRTACQQLKNWNDMGFHHLKIAINLSAKQLHQKNLVTIFSHIIADLKLNPADIDLELTETAAFHETTLPVMRQLKSLGFNISIDDFGTGYSGLSYLKLFSIDKIKIDETFVQDLATNNDSKAIVASTISLAKNFNAQVIAEGVETEDQLKFLQENGCDLIQGYYFSKAVDADEFLQLLKKNECDGYTSPP